MKYCTNCGQELTDKPKFCPSCGHQIAHEPSNKRPKLHKRKPQSLKKDGKEKSSPQKGDQAKPKKKPVHKQALPKADKKTIEQLNKTIKNSQAPVARNAWILAALLLGVLILGFMEIVDLHPALLFIGIFLLVVSVTIGFMFRGRGKKLDKLITGKNLLAAWQLTQQQKNAYAQHLFEHKKAKNNALFGIMTILFVLIFGGFILFIDDNEGRLFMGIMGAGTWAFIALFAFGFPYYYRSRNQKSDGHILIGAKYAYLNGFFHNWDYPLSGLKKINTIQEPFKGISLTYYYTDRTLSNTETIEIPISDEVDSKTLILELETANQ